MKIFFLDTSAFVKYYHEEVGSEEIKRIYSEEERVLVISDISITEFHSATARKVRRGKISKETFEIVRKAFYKDLLNGLYDIEEFNERHKRRSIELIVSHSLHRNLRTLDSFQLSTALLLKEAASPDDLVCFVSADSTLCDIVSKLSFDVINPEKNESNRSQELNL